MVILRDNGQDFTYTRKKQPSFSEMKNAHYHPYSELYYLISGTRKFFIGDSVLTLSPGDMIMIPKGIIHRTTYISSNSPERITASFSDSLIQNIVEEIGQDTFDFLFEDYLIRIPAAQRPYIEDLFEKMNLESKSLDYLSQAMLKKYLEELFIFLARQKLHPLISEEDIKSDDATINAASKYISHHFDEDITLEKIAKKFAMSPTYFSKKFKAQTGFGFKEYLSLTRSMEAARLLKNTNLSITEIASKTGFMTSNYFGDAFKKSLGLSPRDYRKQNQNI